MNTVQRAIAAKKALIEAPWEPFSDGFQGPPLQRKLVVLGDYFTLDPCGGERHIYFHREPYRCARFWGSLARQCKKRGLNFTFTPDDEAVVVACRVVGANGRPLRQLGAGQFTYGVAWDGVGVDPNIPDPSL